MHDRAISIRDVVLAPDIASAKKHQQDIVRLNEFYQQAANTLQQLFIQQKPSAAEMLLLQDIQQTEQLTVASTATLLAMIDNNQPAQAKQFLQDTVSPSYSEWLKRINKLIDAQETRIQQEVKAAREQTNSFQSIMTTVTVIALIIGAVVAVHLVSALKGIIGGEPEYAAMVINQITAGDLTVKVTASGEQSILTSVKHLSQHLTQMTNNSMRAAEELLVASSALLHTSKQNELLTGNQKLETEQGASAVSQMSSTVLEVANHTNTAATLAQTAMSEFSAGQQEVSKTQQSINALADKVAEAADVIHNLSEDGRQIGTVLEVIPGHRGANQLVSLKCCD